MAEFILDSSALLAVLNHEPGGEKVIDLLDRSVISAVNLAEMIGHLKLHGIPANKALDAVTTLVSNVIPFDANLAHIAGDMISQTKEFGLSLGDRACLATAKSMDLEAVTADRAWIKAAAGVKIKAIR